MANDDITRNASRLDDYFAPRTQSSSPEMLTSTTLSEADISTENQTGITVFSPDPDEARMVRPVPKRITKKWLFIGIGTILALVIGFFLIRGNSIEQRIRSCGLVEIPVGRDYTWVSNWSFETRYMSSAIAAAECLEDVFGVYMYEFDGYLGARAGNWNIGVFPGYEVWAVRLR